ncbi:MAG: hypothetical protein Q4Q23_00445 [Methanobacteriaceae archaeon]|nr:hypothetical protein [Methanobacteriaceae archaeon]
MSFNKVIMGCSPFIGAMHFGHRSRLYELDFKNQPENISNIIIDACKNGVENLLLKPTEDMLKSYDIVSNEGYKMNIYGITDCKSFEEDINIFNDLNANTVFLSGSFVDENIDKENYDLLEKNLNIIKDNGFTVGIESCRPFKNTPLIYDSTIINLFSVYMVVLNKFGYMLDCEWFDKENKIIYEENIKKMNKEIIVNRTLATGILKPEEAYNYLKNIEYIDGICVGVSNKKEVEETFNVINKYI